MFNHTLKYNPIIAVSEYEQTILDVNIQSFTEHENRLFPTFHRTQVSANSETDKSMDNFDSPLARSSISKAMSANNSCNKLRRCVEEASAYNNTLNAHKSDGNEIINSSIQIKRSLNANQISKQCRIKHFHPYNRKSAPFACREKKNHKKDKK